MLTLLVLVLFLVFCVSGWTESYFYTRLQEDILVTLRPSILYQLNSKTVHYIFLLVVKSCLATLSFGVNQIY
jgi:hypothetical protein